MFTASNILLCIKVEENIWILFIFKRPLVFFSLDNLIICEYCMTTSKDQEAFENLEGQTKITALEYYFCTHTSEKASELYKQGIQARPAWPLILENKYYRRDNVWSLQGIILELKELNTAALKPFFYSACTRVKYGVLWMTQLESFSLHLFRIKPYSI